MDTHKLVSFGSIDTIGGTDPDADIFDFSGKPQGLTYFIYSDHIDVGFNLISGQPGTDISHFRSQLHITNPAGINQITGPDGQTMIVGDVDTENVKEVASWVTPVPGGVGPVTVAMFMRNAITAHEKQMAAGWLR